MSESIIDRSVFDSLCESVEGDVDFVKEMLSTYYADSAAQIAAMQRALAAGDAEALRRAAHSLKSNSASFGALVLSAHCRELEMMAKAGTLDGAAGKIPQIVAAYDAAKAALLAIVPADAR